MSILGHLRAVLVSGATPGYDTGALVDELRDVCPEGMPMRIYPVDVDGSDVVAAIEAILLVADDGTFSPLLEPPTPARPYGVESIGEFHAALDE